MSHAEMCSPKTAAFTKEVSDGDKMRTPPPPKAAEHSLWTYNHDDPHLLEQ